MPDVHDKFDTDGALHAGHHTLGVGPLQAYPGKAGKDLADQMLLKQRDWNDVGRNVLLNGSMEAWNETTASNDYPDGTPYNWGFFWCIGGRGTVRKATKLTVPASRDEKATSWFPLDPAGSIQYFYSEGIKVVPGETHHFGVWGRTQNDIAPVKIALAYYWDVAGNTNPGPFAGTGVTVMPNTNLTSEWQLFEADLVVPATAAYLCVYYTLTSVNPTLEQYCVLDQAFYDKSGASMWAAFAPVLNSFNDPGINMVFNPEFDLWSIGALPYSYSQALDATYPGSFVKNSTVSRTLKNCLLYTKGATVGPTATDDLYCDNYTKKLVSGDYIVSVWVLASGNNAANPLAGIEGLIISATNSSFSAGVVVSNAILTPINAVGANEVGAWIKYSVRVAAPSGGPYFKFGLRFTNNPSTTQGWYFTQFTAYKADAETLPAVAFGYQGSNASTTLTTYSAIAPGLEVSFVAPPSGSVWITIFNDISMSGTAAGVGSYEVRTASGGGGSVVQAADDTRSNLFAGVASRVAASGPRMLVTGLTPGTTYWARTMARQGTGTGNATFNVRRLLVEPYAIYG